VKKTKVFCVKPNLLKLWCVGGRAAALRANRFPDRRSELMLFYPRASDRGDGLDRGLLVYSLGSSRLAACPASLLCFLSA
jgi:hypothetical protein